MIAKLEWYDDKTANWIELDPAKHPTLAPKERFRVYLAGRYNMIFHGDQWDATILDSVENLSYWAGYHGAKLNDFMNADSYYDGRMDGEYGRENAGE